MSPLAGRYCLCTDSVVSPLLGMCNLQLLLEPLITRSVEKKEVFFFRAIVHHRYGGLSPDVTDYWRQFRQCGHVLVWVDRVEYMARPSLVRRSFVVGLLLP